MSLLAVVNEVTGVAQTGGVLGIGALIIYKLIVDRKANGKKTEGPKCIHLADKSEFDARTQLENEGKAILDTKEIAEKTLVALEKNVLAQEQVARDTRHSRRIDQSMLLRDIEANGGMDKCDPKTKKLALDDTHILDAITDED